MLELCVKLYIRVYGYSILKIENMSENGHIVYTQNSKTVLHKYRRKNKNVENSKLTKRSFKQANERPIRPNSTPILKHSTNAWLSNNYKNPQKLWSLLRPQHCIPSSKHP
jgi:hypothetical protein